MPYRIGFSTHKVNLNFYLQIHTLYGWPDYLWIPLVPETKGHIDQYDLNAFSMANTLAFSFFRKKPLRWVFGLNKIFSINFWVQKSFFYLPVPGWWNDITM